MSMAAPARRSQASSWAPVRRSTPSMMARFPSTWIWAPMRLNSSIYRKRLFQTLSVMTLVPLARHSAAATWGCMSVGKPG